MYKRRYHLPGTAPATLIPSPDEVKPAIKLIEYDAETLQEREVTDVSELTRCRESDRVSWINIEGLGDVELLRTVAQQFGIHPLALEDVLNTAQRPKLEEYAEHFFVVTQMVYFKEQETLCAEQVSIFLGNNFVLTIQESEGDVFEAVRARLRHGKGFSRSRKADYLAYMLIDAMIDHFFPVLESIGESVEQLEERILQRPQRGDVSALHGVKRELLQLRRTVWPMREVVSALVRDDSSLVSEGTKIFLRDCYDHTVQAIDIIESYRDLTSGMIDLYLSSVSHRTNEIMRVLTVVAVIFMPLTFLAGVYGMNFDPDASPFSMPELRYRYAYPIFWICVLLIAVSMMLFFRKKRWL